MNAKRLASRRCPETCNKVQREVSRAVHSVLDRCDELTGSIIQDCAIAAFEAARDHGTLVIRASLEECEEELLAANEEISQLHERIADLERELEAAGQNIFSTNAETIAELRREFAADLP